MKARFLQTGHMAMAQAAWGIEYDVSAPKPFSVEGSVAVVEVDGPLCEHRQPCFDSYEDIEVRARAAFASDAKTILLKVCSPGGEAGGCMELSRTLRGLADTTGKRLVAYCHGKMASAAYALGCAADEIVAPPTATVGSVGVFDAILDETARDAALGVKFTFIASGARKLDGNSHVPTTDGAKAAIGRQVDELARLFFELVADMRGLSVDDVAALEGEAFIGAQALDNRLLDSVGVYGALLSRLQTEGSSPMAQAKTVAWEEALKALMEHAEGDDEEKSSKAKKMLAALVAEDKPESEPEKKEAKAEEPAPEKKTDEEGDKKAQAATVDLAARLHALEVQIAQERETKARAELLGKRSDFSPEVRKTLEALPLEVVRKAVETWPKAPLSPVASAAAAALAMPTITGESEGQYVAPISPTDQAAVDRAFGRGTPAKTTSLVGTLDRAAAKAFLASRSAQEGK